MTTMTTPKPSLAAALANLATREARRAVRSLGDTSDRHTGVHEARKSIRRLKSLLDLGGAHFDAGREPIVRGLTRLASSLSSLRDAHVAVTIARQVAGESPSAAWTMAIAWLEVRRDAMLDEALRKDPGFMKRRQRLAGIGGAIAGLPWDAVERHDIERALARSERRVAKAGEKAFAQATTGNLHRWRRRARRLRMQFDFWRKALKTTGRSAHHRAHQDKAAQDRMSTLSDALGARQDLRSLRGVLRSLGDAEAIAPLLDDVRAAARAVPSGKSLAAG